jgi:hypothetical protein
MENHMRNGGVGKLAINSALVIHSLVELMLNPSALASALVINSLVGSIVIYLAKRICGL